MKLISTNSTLKVNFSSLKSSIKMHLFNKIRDRVKFKQWFLLVLKEEINT